MSSVKDTRKAHVLEVLNKARSMELQAVHQYMNQHYNLDNLDYGELAVNMKLIAIDEMRHAEQFAERIKELDGEPTSDLAAKIVKAQDVHVVYTFDTALEDETLDAYNNFRKTCTENEDILTARLFAKIIEEEQLHYNYFGNIDKHLSTLGDVYLSKIAGTPNVDTPSKGFVTPTPAA